MKLYEIRLWILASDFSLRALEFYCLKIKKEITTPVILYVPPPSNEFTGGTERNYGC